MGVNQNYQAVACATAVINLALMTGNMGKPGTGANSITGQANAMGSRLFGNTTSLLGGHDFLNPLHRQKVASALAMDEKLIPRENSWAYDQILPAAGCGEKKGTFISSERRISVIRKIAEPPGDAFPDFEIFRRIARHWGCAETFKAWTSSPAAVFDVLKKVSKG